MLAWMDRAAVIETLTTGRVTYYSRSRGARWRKGDTSGHTQTLKAFRIDCDHDTILVLIEQVGRACHTGRRSCFYHEVRDDGWVDVSANSFDI
jgi:phosphoribosyl-AMP cyclohydrolase